ncbi:MAG: protein DpdD [Nocardioides sp.]
MNETRIDELVLAFFSTPNGVWPGMAADHPTAGRITPFLRALDARGECPLILPRRDAEGDASIVYVVCWDHSHAGRIRPLLQAAVADYLSPFDGRVASLRASDPVEASILSMVGAGTTFALRPTGQTEGRLVLALQRLARSLAGRPLRNPVLPRPVGRMLREFDLALAAGATEQSAAILQEIERAGGISHENVAFLQIQRLGRLGRDRELLGHGSLPTIVHTEPPQAVREAILSAWGRCNLHVDSSLDLDAGAERLAHEAVDVAMLVGKGLASTSDPDAVAVGGLVALARGDAELAQALLLNDQLSDELRIRLTGLLPTTDVLGKEATDRANEVVPGPEEVDARDVERERVVAPARSWLEWLDQLGTAPSVPPVNDLVGAWEPSWRVDVELSTAIDDLSDLATDALLAGVAAFLDTADPGRPAPRTARALASRYLIEERFGPADLSALAALVSIFLSSAPGRDEYSSLLDDIATFAPQWTSIASAAQALDLADAVACGPRPVPEAQAQFLSTVLGPLNSQRHRLSGSLRSLAAIIANDGGLDWDWAVPETSEDVASPELPAGTSVLLYSLDAGTLTRVAASLSDQYPTLSVHQSSDKVGNAALRQYSRKADLIAIATGRAAHAATGFIIDNAERGKVCYPDGCGAASMLRVVEAGLEELRSAN